MKKLYLFTFMLGAMISTTTHAENIGLDVSVGFANVRPDISSPVVGADASNETVPIINLTYFFTDNLALNTAAGITRHEFRNSSGLLGSASMAPFHLIGEYHFLPKEVLSPYVGVGIHHTVFFHQSGPAFDALQDFPADTGPVLEVGANYKLNKDYFVNLDFKKFYLETDVTFKGASTKTETIKLNPLLVVLAVGMHF